MLHDLTFNENIQWIQKDINEKVNYAISHKDTINKQDFFSYLEYSLMYMHINILAKCFNSKLLNKPQVKSLFQEWFHTGRTTILDKGNDRFADFFIRPNMCNDLNTFLTYAIVFNNYYTSDEFNKICSELMVKVDPFMKYNKHIFIQKFEYFKDVNMDFYEVAKRYIFALKLME